jgi:hypothetical protein
MAALTVNHLSIAGTKPTFQNSSASDTATYDSGRNTFLVYKNTGGSGAVLTITPSGTLHTGQAKPVVSVTVAATTGENWIPLFQDLDDGNGAGTVTIAATNSGATLQVALVRADWA